MGLETGFFGRIMTSFIAFHADAGSPLMGARDRLNRCCRYVGGVTAAPEHVISAYRKLVTRGLFTPEKGNNHDR
jgi:hypothetical protein